MYSGELLTQIEKVIVFADAARWLHLADFSEVTLAATREDKALISLRSDPPILLVSSARIHR